MNSLLLLDSLFEFLLWINWTEFLIVIFGEIQLLLRNLTFSHSLTIISLFSSINKESFFQLFLGCLDRLSCLDGIILLVIRVSKFVLDFLWHFGFLNWFSHLQSSAALSPLDGLISINNLILIILENNWNFSSLFLFKLLLWG